MRRVLFIQNGEYEGPGLFARVMEECGVEFDTLDAWRGELPPAEMGEYDGFAIGGGEMSVYEGDRYPFIAAEVEFARKLRATKKPLIGMCLGAQVMAEALGGKVTRNAEKEIGFYEVRFSAAAESDPLWQGLAAPLRPVHWHGDVFSLPPGATLLASSERAPNQLFRMDENWYGIQFHLEIDLPSLAKMIITDSGNLLANGIEPAEFLRQGERHLPETERVARAVFGRWARMLSGTELIP